MLLVVLIKWRMSCSTTESFDKKLLLKVFKETITQCFCWNYGDCNQAYSENTGFQDKEVKDLELVDLSLE